mmetsp:Transcript_65007/g.157267  ORF Transcript_65007/g.157267 Transcript_65007/m.157267 type:complete len:287 (-) Transcript_65007:236-1096(-)
MFLNTSQPSWLLSTLHLPPRLHLRLQPRELRGQGRDRERAAAAPPAEAVQARRLGLRGRVRPRRRRGEVAAGLPSARVDLGAARRLPLAGSAAHGHGPPGNGLQVDGLQGTELAGPLGNVHRHVHELGPILLRGVCVHSVQSSFSSIWRLLVSVVSVGGLCPGPGRLRHGVVPSRDPDGAAQVGGAELPRRALRQREVVHDVHDGRGSARPLLRCSCLQAVEAPVVEGEPAGLAQHLPAVLVHASPAVLLTDLRPPAYDLDRREWRAQEDVVVAVAFQGPRDRLHL